MPEYGMAIEGVPAKDFEEVLGDVVPLDEAPQAVVLDDIFVSADGYYGNEASHGTVYAEAAVVLEVPGGEHRGRFAGVGAPSLEAGPGAGLFAGCRRGLLPHEEEQAAKRRLRQFSKGRPLIGIEELRMLADELGVSTEGTAGQIAARVERASKRQRWRELKAFGFTDPMFDDEFSDSGDDLIGDGVLLDFGSEEDESGEDGSEEDGSGDDGSEEDGSGDDGSGDDGSGHDAVTR